MTTKRLQILRAEYEEAMERAQQGAIYGAITQSLQRAASFASEFTEHERAMAHQAIEGTLTAALTVPLKSPAAAQARAQKAAQLLEEAQALLGALPASAVAQPSGHTELSPEEMLSTAGPMDLVCWITADATTGRPRAHVRLPNPEYPYDAPEPIRHRCLDRDIRTEHAWGSSGPGPSDVALNVLAAFLPTSEHAVGEPTADGTQVADVAWKLLEPFRTAFLAHMPAGGAVVHAARVRPWLELQLSALERRNGRAIP